MKRLAFAPLIALLIVALVAPTASAQPVRNELFQDIPVTGTRDGAPFAGTLDITNIARNAQGDALLITGQLFDQAGGLVANLTAELATLTEGDGPGGRCQILLLEFEGLFLDLLGLQIDLSAFTLDISAVRGPGRLLGNLLCAVAGLLDGGGTLAKLDRILDRINDLL